MKNSSMKKYRVEIKNYSNLYKHGFISEKDMSSFISHSVVKLLETQINEQLDNLSVTVYKSYAKGLN